MIADFTYIDCETIFGRHKFALPFKKFYQFVNIHIVSRTSVKMLVFAKLINNGFF